METQIQRPETARRVWAWFALVLITLTLLAAVRWMVAHPYAIHSDESWYINEAQIDTQAQHDGGLVNLGRWILHGDTSRPPAYRLVVLPFTIMFGYSTLLVRLVTLACFLVSACFVYLTTRGLAGSVAGAIAILVFCLSPEALQSSIFFSTEGPLFLAVSAMLYFLSLYWSDSRKHTYSWIGLGIAVGVGLLSKATFASLAIPVLLFTSFIAFRKREGLSGMFYLAKAGVIAILVAGPWWRVNFRSAFDYALFSNQTWSRHSLGSHTSLMTWVRWFESVFLSLLGPGIGILVVLILGAYFRKRIGRKENLLSPAQRTALFACAFAGLPLVLAQMFGTNFNLRLISPVVIPLAIAVGILTSSSGWVASRKPALISGALFSVQFLMLVFPVLMPNNHLVDPGTVSGLPWRIMIRFEQWDWKPLLDISNSCGLPSPKISFVDEGRALNGKIQYGWSDPAGVPRIAYMGNGRAFHGSQIQYPWIAQGFAFPDVTWLWRFEDGPIDWKKVQDMVDRSDIVITAPNYVGQVTDKQDVDNQHNAEFASRLGEDPLIQKPIRFEMGQLDRVEVLVFLKKSLACH